MINAGFRPGSRDPFVSAKGPKTIDAQSSHRGWTPEEERPNSLHSNKGRQMGASLPKARQQASLRRTNGKSGLIKLHGTLHHDKQISMQMKINANLDKVSVGTMSLLKEVHS